MVAVQRLYFDFQCFPYMHIFMQYNNKQRLIATQ